MIPSPVANHPDKDNGMPEDKRGTLETDKEGPTGPNIGAEDKEGTDPDKKGPDKIADRLPKKVETPPPQIEGIVQRAGRPDNDIAGTTINPPDIAPNTNIKDPINGYNADVILVAILAPAETPNEEERNDPV